MPEPFRSILTDYLATLERYHLLTYGQQIVRAVAELERPDLQRRVQSAVRHLIVDEYPDINPAQERLIRLLTGPQVGLCVVGDDDQAIYQWRGSDVDNIVGFDRRYPGARRFTVTTNRRSRPQIVERANAFVRGIPGRLDKSMLPSRPGAAGPEVVVWSAASEAEEADRIAAMIKDLNATGVPFRDIAVLVRSCASYPRLVQSFARSDIPVQPGGRTGPFEQPEAIVLGKAVAWLTGIEWRQGYERGVAVADRELFDEFAGVFGLDPSRAAKTAQFLRKWKSDVPNAARTADLVGELYQLLDCLGVADWDANVVTEVNRLGTLARFSALLADYESVRRRARPDASAPGEQVGGQDRGDWYYRNLAIYIVNHASGAYEGFDGEPDLGSDAVDLTTVHRAKGLEWPVIFVPSLAKSRFPSSKSGRQQDWLVPRTLFNAARYEGGDADERRLFYVALTRARDWVSLSRHDRVTTRGVAASPYWLAHRDLVVDPSRPARPEVQVGGVTGEDPITVTYSEMAAFLDCAHAYRLRTLIGFQPRLATELGYGKAVHHVLRTVADVRPCVRTGADRRGRRRHPGQRILPAHREQSPPTSS